MIKLTAFLGNPGKTYAKTRHNIAWLLTQETPFTRHVRWKKKFQGRYAEKIIVGEKCIFLKPETYMNKSGESVRASAQFFHINAQEVLVVHDDIELAFGQIAFKMDGGLAGHNGLRSIASALGTRNFHRLRLGISQPPNSDVSSYVLRPFSSEEQEVLPRYLEKAAEALQYCLTEGIELAEKKYTKTMVL